MALVARDHTVSHFPAAWHTADHRSAVSADQHVELHVLASADVRSSLEIVTPAFAARAYPLACQKPVAPLALLPVRMFQNHDLLRDRPAPLHLR